MDQTIVGSGDPMFAHPYVDLDQWRDQPVRHHYIHGGFEGTETRFSFYFPPADQYQGRFFQHITPVPISENLAQAGSGEDDKIGFSISSGAYFVESNGGGMSAMPPASDPTVAGYRANAAVAQYSRVIAAHMYGPHRPYGYAYGGSGGAYRTIGGFENTTGVWDGVVPYVVGSPMAIPNVFTVRVLAMRLLAEKFPAIIDAVEPGGSGDMYSSLNEEERSALSEVTRMGFPPRGWFNYKTLGMGALSVLFDGIAAIDPGYFQDFWTVPGYAGANPPESLLRARIQHKTTIKKVVTLDEAIQLGWEVAPQVAFEAPRGGVDNAWQQLEAAPVGFVVESAPPEMAAAGGNLVGARLKVLSGAAAGQVLPLRKIDGDRVVIGSAVVIGSEVSPAAANLNVGDEVQFDNSDFLAIQYYHRHQVPPQGFPVWDQFRDAEGKPLYPQRPMLVGPIIASSAGGSVQSGRFEGKMIVVAALMDQDAFPWQADWYRAKVESNLGPSLDDHFRLWFTDHALHGDQEQQQNSTRTVSYLGVLHQALRDLSAWVETGVEPPASTSYQVVDGQVLLPQTAAGRKGIQPVVTLTVNGGEKAVVKAGDILEFSGIITVPPQAGKVVYAEFDFDGSGSFLDKAVLEPVNEAGTIVKVRMTHTYTQPGTYFPVLRAASNRGGQKNDLFALVKNLARVRVVIE